jgi:dolichol-phosphate mannosyltransferase
LKTLLFIPTYNEKDNAPKLCEELLALNLPIDILFIDDNSPDGTGRILDEIAAKNPSVKVAHRAGKQGIGSAHYYGITYAYENGYQILMSMDADFTHRPEYIVKLLALKGAAEVVIASRYMQDNSLPGWNFLRRLLTRTGHVLTSILLRMNYDATGALRLYRIDRIPKQAFDIVDSKGYSFFFESLYVLFRNGYKIHEFPIELPARTYGSSKMDLKEVFKSVRLLFKTFFQSIISPSKYKVSKPLKNEEIDTRQHDPQGWDAYWNQKKSGWSVVYDLVADIYRKLLIRPSLNYFIRKTFKKGDKLLHAGCGGGQVDSQIRNYAEILPLDISVNALNWYRRVNGDCQVIHGSIFEIPLPDQSLDGIYNLGVMEHFTEDEIGGILKEFRRTLKPEGKILLFWPPEFGVSVSFFKGLKSILGFFGKKDAKFHPDEITRVRSKEHVVGLLNKAGFSMYEYYFGIKDMYTQAMIVAGKSKVTANDSGELPSGVQPAMRITANS